MVRKEIQPLIEPLDREPLDQPVQPKRSWLAKLLVVTGLLLAGGMGAYSTVQLRSPSQPSAPPTPQATVPPTKAVAALGRLDPVGEVTHLSAYNSLEGARIDELLIKDGDHVYAGQVVATLTTRQSRLAALLQAQKKVEVAKAQLERVKAGAKAGDIAAQRAASDRFRAELSNAQMEYRRNQVLFESGALSASDLDSKRLAMETIEAQLAQAEADLGSVAEVRPVDVRVAAAEVEDAIAAVEAAKADLELTNIRAPIDGEVLEVHVRSGEIVGTDGIAEIARTYQMYAVAEVYETDIEKIKLGQKATIVSNAISSKLHGKVVEIGRQVERQSTHSINPLSETDNKVIKVKVALDPDDSKQVSGLTNLQVQVIFQE